MFLNKTKYARVESIICIFHGLICHLESKGVSLQTLNNLYHISPNKYWSITLIKLNFLTGNLHQLIFYMKLKRNMNDFPFSSQLKSTYLQ